MGLMKGVRKIRISPRLQVLDYATCGFGRPLPVRLPTRRAPSASGAHDRDHQQTLARPEAVDAGIWPRSHSENWADEMHIPVERVHALLKMARQPVFAPGPGR